MKAITTLAFAACTLAAGAQTQSSPLPLVMGENSCTAESWSTVYFSYKAPADQLVTLDGISSITVTSGDKDIPAAKNSNTSTAIFAVKGGESYELSTFTTSGDVRFAASATPRAYNDGTSCADPLTASEEPFFVPFSSEGGFMGKKIPVFISYTAPADGRLEMTFDSAPGALAYSTGCDADYVDITNGEYLGISGWMASFDVVKGEEYIIRGTASAAMMASFTVGTPEPGMSCSDPWNAKRGSNEIPAEAGSYWYRITTPAAPANCFITLTSAATLPGGKITVKTSCSSTTGDISLNEIIALRIPAAADTDRLLNIEKSVKTDVAESFELKFEDYQTYDKFETAEPLEPGVTYTTPAFGGTYYYAVTAPDKGSYFLDLAASEAVVAGTTVELYDQGKDFLALATGTDRIHWAATPETTYVIKWICPDTMRSLPFTVTFNAVQPGETESDPIAAQLGSNNVPASKSIYFSYTAVSDSWLAVTPSDASHTPAVHTISAEGVKGDVTTFPTDGGLKFEASTGTRYLLSFTGIDTGMTFTLAEIPFAEGETPANPIAVTGNGIAIPDSAGIRWYRYEATDNGFLDITTTLKYAYDNRIEVYVNEILDSTRHTMTAESYGSDRYAPLPIIVERGNAVYFCVTTASPQTGATINIAFREGEPGETPGNPLVINFDTNPMEYTFARTVGYGDSPVWYSIRLTGEVFDLTSDGCFGMSIYKADDTTTPIATSGGSISGPNYLKNVVINSAGTYLLKLTSATEAFKAILSERAATQGEIPAKAITITAESVPFEITFPAVEYGSMPVWYSILLRPGEFTLTQPETATSALYSAEDFMNPIARLAFSYANDNYTISNLTIEEEGRYYYCMESAYSDCHATISGSAVVTCSGIESATPATNFSATPVSDGILVEGDGCTVSIFTTDGQLLTTRRVEGSGMIHLPAGIYILHSDGLTRKIAVR